MTGAQLRMRAACMMPGMHMMSLTCFPPFPPVRFATLRGVPVGLLRDLGGPADLLLLRPLLPLSVLVVVLRLRFFD